MDGLQMLTRLPQQAEGRVGESFSDFSTVGATLGRKSNACHTSYIPLPRRVS